MRYDVELILNAGSANVTTEYTIYFASCPALGYIDCTLNKLDISSSSPSIPLSVWQQLADDGGTIQLYNPGDTYLGALNITGFDGSNILFFEGNDSCPTFSNNACYFTFSITTINTKLYTLELYENESISQNWRFSDLQTFAPLGSFSRQFRVPATQKNLEALGYLNDVNYASTTDYFQTKVKAEIRVQTLPIAIGFIRVMRVITQADVLTDFELTFYAESPDLFNAIAGKKLKDIAALADLNVVLNYNTVTTATGNPVLYTLTDFGQKWDETGVAGTRSIFSSTGGNFNQPIDLTPALKWQWIFEKIITEAGFRYEGNDIDTILSRYYAPWINAKQIQFTADYANIQCSYYLSTDMVVTSTWQTITPVTESYDNGGNLVSGIFTAPGDGIYHLQYWRTVTSTATDILEMRIAVNNGVTITYYDLTPLAVTTGPINSQWEYYLQLITGDLVYFQVRSSLGSGNITLQSGSSLDSGTGVTWLDANATNVGVIDFQKNAPDVTQAEFLRDVFNMHCCIIVPDRTTYNKVIIEPISTYVGSGESRDWSAKLDISKDIALSNTSDFQSKRLTFTYSAGEDVLSKVYTNLNRIYGDYKIENFTVSENDVPNDFARDAEQRIQLVTQSTPCNYIKGSTVVIPKFVNQTGEFVSPKLRCLFNAGSVDMLLYDYGTFTFHTVTVPILNHYEHIVPAFTDLDLNWAPEIPLYIIGPNPLNNLYNLYWRQYLNEIYSPQCRIMEAHFALDLADILGFKFSDKIWVKNAWWRILEINDYKVGDAMSTQVKLLKLVNAIPETSVRPDAVTEGGMIEFIDQNGDPAPGTKNACERYGYRWDPTTNTCSAFTTNPQKIIPNVDTQVGQGTNTVNNAIKTIVTTDTLNNDPSNYYTVAAGVELTLAADNMSSIAVGQKQNMQGSGGVAMFGRNIYTKQSGQHLGGGYMNNTASTSPDGYSQSGVIMLQSKQAFTVPGGQFLYINGVANSHIEIPDDTCWNCLLSYTIQDDNLTGNYESGLLSFAMTKSGGIAAVSAITPLNVIGGIGAYVFTFAVSVAVTNLHRIGYQVTGTPFPDTFHVSASLSYTQSKLT